MSRDALIVGISQYENLENLGASARDAEAIAQRLHEHGNFRVRRLPEYEDAEGNPKVGKRTPVTLSDLKAAIIHLFTPDGDNVPEAALLYFSGHGLRDDDGSGYLAASDVDTAQGIFGFSLQDLRQLLEDSPVKQQIVWLDCCHGGTLLDFTAVDPGTKGGRDRCLITASREFEPAFVDRRTDSSVLTAALLEGLDPTKKPTGSVYATELVSYVQEKLKKAPQVPLAWTGPDRILLTETDNPVPQTASPQNIPRSGAVKFVGRDAVLQDLHAQLQGEQPVAVTAVAGMGGIGKTELAIRYALGYWQAHYPAGVCWLRCRGAEMASQVVKFAAVEMGLVVPDGLTTEQQVRWCWRNWQPAAGAVLVVLDDVTDYGAIADYLPPVDLRFRVLMTTRSQNLGASVRTVPLDLLSPEAALELLTELEGAGRVMADRVTAEELCDRLGHLPLGVELAGRYLQQKRDLPLEKMLARLEQKGLGHRSLAERSPDMTGRLGVEAAIALSWEELQREETRRLAYLLSLFALAPIPWRLVAGCLPDEDEEELEDARDRLVNLSLVRRVDEGVYQLHQLVREYVGVRLEDSAAADGLKRAYCRGMVAVARQVPQSLTIEQVATLAPAVPHMQEATTSSLLNWVEDDDLLSSFVGVARFYEGQGLYGQALPWCDACLKLSTERLGEEHPDVASSLNNLAELYRSQGRYTEAEPLYVQALALYRRILGEEHPDVATSLNNLAVLYDSQGRYAEAEPLFVQALALYRRILGEGHPDVATSLNNLAELYRSQGRYAEAEPLYIQAIAIATKRLGPEHPNTRTFIENFVVLLKKAIAHNQTDRFSDHPLTQNLLEQARTQLQIEELQRQGF